MKTLALLVVSPIVFGAAGYAAGLSIKPEAAEHASETATDTAEETHAATPEPEHEAPEEAAEAHTEADAHGEESEEMAVLRLGRMTLPIERAHSISYYVMDIAVAFGAPDLVEEYRADSGFTALRDASLSAIHRASETRLMHGAAVDSDQLAAFVAEELSQSFPDVEDVLFLSLYKQDVPRT
ncbi:hypothetical protein [Histidinibacterium aquaticum]|uniref:Flagellar protein FliL n=1 Tax=Histidinibacterium aquaticum TaxID=2613962 RepID=A0A5J5GNL7_9RHOB|nr:hypothetical protein [Histidinibacterium aquaticum]KAA9009976.1 hypothetical protein F3S47_01555 [Histidinibacterium aquaticum]